MERLIYELKNFDIQSNSFSADIPAKDELKELENEIKNLIQKFKAQK